MHHYHRLRELIGAHPIGAPESEEFLEILKLLFRPDEVELAVLLDFKLKKAGEVAQRAGISVEDALKKLEAMTDRGAVLAKNVDGEMAYALLSTYPGLYEYPFWADLDAQTQQRLAQLWQAYYMKAMAAELASANPPWRRVLPAEEALPQGFEIFPFEVASQMLAGTETIAVANCVCRIITGNCDKPLDVCLAFDGAARFLVERGMARMISLEEAREVLKRAEKAGLVHTGTNNADRLMGFMCNCCSCCCHFLRLITEHNYADGLARSSYRASINQTDCTGCGVCAGERCPMKAVTVEGETAALKAEKCIGCGLCVSTCPTGAITLVKREDYQHPPATAAELVKLVVGNKQKKAREE
ncbi:MAG: 4Fe-4S dicluster domain-containing protein [Desulfocucumaceae bacterium]